MPYYIYPKVYNFYYNKIKNENSNIKFKIFFSGSIYNDVYSKFEWKAGDSNQKLLNRIEIIKFVIDEFKNEIFFINKKSDLKNNKIFKKKIIFSLQDKMINKKKYTLSFQQNYNFLSKSAFNLNCPGAVMPICHHMIEGIKFGSIPISSSNEFLNPPLDKNLYLEYYNKDTLLKSIYNALNMKNEEVLLKRKKLLKFYNDNLSPQSFKQNFLKILKKNSEKEIIACNDHESVERFKNIKID